MSINSDLSDFTSDSDDNSQENYPSLQSGSDRLTDFKIFKNSEKYNITDVLDNKKSPLHAQKMGYAFIDKDYNLTDDLNQAVRFIGIVGALEANPMLEKSYTDITINALHNKRIVVSGIQLDIPMYWINKDIPYDGKQHSSILKLRYDKNNSNITYYSDLDLDRPEFSNSNFEKSELESEVEDKFFDLGRYHIYKDKKGIKRCYLKVNNFITYPFCTFSNLIHKNDECRKKAHLRT